MLTIRSTAIAIMLTGLAGGPSLAATCNLTVQGAHVVDDEDCSIVKSGGTTRIIVGTYGTITVRGLAMSARPVDTRSSSRWSRSRSTSLGSVLTLADVEGRTCYFGQKATLCVE